MGNDLTVDFSRGGNGIDHCGTGWAEPEGTGVWMMGQQSLLVLPRPEVPGDYRLELDLGALTGPDHPCQRLVVGVNGTVMGEFMLVAGSVEHCVLPWPVIGREPGLTLVLSHPDAWRPSELTGGEGDHRELSLFLERLRLVPHEAAPAASAAAPPPVSTAPVPAAQAPIPPKPPVQPSPAQSPPAAAADKPAAPAPAAPAPAAPSAASPPAATQPAARPAAPGPVPAAQAAPSPQVPASRPTPAPAVTRPAAPAEEARVPWWKKLLG